jgi:hypothetical protein
MSEDNIKQIVVVKEVGKPAEKCIIENSLEAFQKLVDGYVQQFHVPESILSLFVNEDGIPLNLPFNAPVQRAIQFRGTIVNER